jgi:hypothetical protein
MARTCVVFTMLLLSPLVSAWSQSKNQGSAPTTRFVIDENRAYVYLRFDHMGPGVKFSDDEPPKRVWFRFVNNCNVGIVLRTFGVPEGSQKDEIGVMHRVVKDAPQFRIYGITTDPPPLSTQSSEPPQEIRMPMGYDFELSELESIPPGKSALFSVPVTHLSKSWHIEIPYTFDVPSGKGPRQPIVGGEPKMVLLYSAWDLPPDIQQQLPKAR